MSEPRRKGALRRADIPPAIRAQLNAGTLETATLAEFLVLDFAALLTAAIPDLPSATVRRVREAHQLGVTKRMELVGSVLHDHLGFDDWERIAAHPSDTVRGWACYLIGRAPDTKLKDRLTQIRPLADDPHFGVREWAWIAIRPQLAEQLPQTVKLLTPWTRAKSAFVRRFAVESVRPRGVWCSHIDALKTEPEQALPLLEPLKADPEKYVQDSVANWLNDASKSQPGWVRSICERWLAESATPATVRICRRAMRTIGNE